MSPLNILFVDDNPGDWQDFISKAVQPVECVFEIISNDSTNLDAITPDYLSRFHVAICNYSNDKTNIPYGLLFIKKIRELSDKIPIFVLTGYHTSDKEDTEKFFRGFMRYKVEWVLSRNDNVSWEGLKDSFESIARQMPVGIAKDSLRILHLSDLHFKNEQSWKSRLQWLTDDIKKGDCLGFPRLDFLVVSGDFTDKGKGKGFDLASEFIQNLIADLSIRADHCILVPGNHDVQYNTNQYKITSNEKSFSADDLVKKDDIYLARNPRFYKQRFKGFSEKIYKQLKGCAYPDVYDEQGIAALFPESQLQFMTLNSSWQIDQYYPKRSGVNEEAVAHVIRSADQQIERAITEQQLSKGTHILRIGVWHHAVTGSDQMKNVNFIDNLRKNDVKLCLHGDVHEEQRELVRYWETKQMYIVGTGSFGAEHEALAEGSMRLYSLLEVQRDLRKVRVHTRCQKKSGGAWDGYYVWKNSEHQGVLPYYDIDFGQKPSA